MKEAICGVVLGLIILSGYVYGYFADRKEFQKLKESFLFPIEEIKLAMICAASGDGESLRAEICGMEQIIKYASVKICGATYDAMTISYINTRNALRDIAIFHLNLAKESLEKGNYYDALCMLAKSNREVLEQKIIKG